LGGGTKYFGKKIGLLPIAKIKETNNKNFFCFLGKSAQKKNFVTEKKIIEINYKKNNQNWQKKKYIGKKTIRGNNTINLTKKIEFVKKTKHTQKNSNTQPQKKKKFGKNNPQKCEHIEPRLKFEKKKNSFD